MQSRYSQPCEIMLHQDAAQYYTVGKSGSRKTEPADLTRILRLQ